VRVCSSGVEALELLEGGADFDAILCDLMMPEVSGMELCRRLSATRPDLASRVVFMTGGAFTPGAREFIRECGRPTLTKPFDLGELRRQVDEVVAQSAD
jgi:CheY-like chemotaxis protein